MKIRLWATADECRQMAQLLIDAPVFEVASVSEPYAERGPQVLVRVFVETRPGPTSGDRSRCRRARYQYS